MTHDDLSLMRRLQAGNEQAMAALLAEHWTPVVSYAFGLLGSWDEAEDVAQEAFVRLWARRKKWSSGSAGALVHRIARNAALDVLKSPRHAARREDADMLASEDTPDRDVELSELVGRGVSQTTQHGTDKTTRKADARRLLLAPHGLLIGCYRA